MMRSTFLLRSLRLFFVLLVGLLLGSILFALNVGKYPLSPSQLWETISCSFSGQCQGNTAQTVLWQIRLPRIFAACFVGAALACAGATYQGMFKNPLVSQDILGVSAGAGFVLCVSLIASHSRTQDPILVLVLSGIAIGSLLGAGISLLKILADPFTQLPSITFWLLGSLTSINQQDLIQLIPMLLLGIIPIFLLRWRLNLLSLDEDEAQTLGVPIKRTRWILIVFTTLCTASAVAMTGIIGWVGLLVPHIARLLVGANFIRLLPTSLLLGASFLLLTDTLARTIAPIELPLGILTSACGAPFFLYLLVRGQK